MFANWIAPGQILKIAVDFARSYTATFLRKERHVPKLGSRWKICSLSAMSNLFRTPFAMKRSTAMEDGLSSMLNDGSPGKSFIPSLSPDDNLLAGAVVVVARCSLEV